MPRRVTWCVDRAAVVVGVRFARPGSCSRPRCPPWVPACGGAFAHGSPSGGPVTDRWSSNPWPSPLPLVGARLRRGLRRPVTSRPGPCPQVVANQPARTAPRTGSPDGSPHQGHRRTAPSPAGPGRPTRPAGRRHHHSQAQRPDHRPEGPPPCPVGLHGCARQAPGVDQPNRGTGPRTRLHGRACENEETRPTRAPVTRAGRPAGRRAPQADRTPGGSGTHARRVTRFDGDSEPPRASQPRTRGTRMVCRSRRGVRGTER